VKLGIHVNTDRHLDRLVGIVRAAVAAGHEVSVFTMAEGCRLLEDRRFTELCTVPNVTMSFCDLNATQMAVRKEGIPEEIVCGSQYHNVIMVGWADRVIVL
jgi:peroxiredoxin family protein